MKSLSILSTSAMVGAAVIFSLGCQSDDPHGDAGHTQVSAVTKPYPLDKCIVSDDAFDHGEAVVFVYQSQEIKLCCKDCRKDFDEDPSKYLSKLAGAK
ncbi:MAG: hypothetical protein U1F61_31305 [Opitutaceae bacterium]